MFFMTRRAREAARVAELERDRRLVIALLDASPKAAVAEYQVRTFLNWAREPRNRVAVEMILAGEAAPSFSAGGSYVWLERRHAKPISEPEL